MQYQRPLSGLLLAAALTLPGLHPAGSDPAAPLSWAAAFNGPGNFYDYARATATDAAGNVYVTGSSDDDYVTLKYSPAGALLWSARYAGAAGGVDSPSALAVDAEGNVYVTGASYGGFPARGGTDFDFATVKYDPQGNQLWAARYNGTGNRDDAPASLLLGANGSVHVAGYAWMGASAWDFAAVKYDADGNQQWAAAYDWLGGADRAAAAALDPAGNLYLAGESTGAVGDADYATAKFSPGGALLWSARYAGTGNSPDSALAVAADSNGAWVTGAAAAGTDCATVRYSAAGEPEWVRHAPGAGAALTADPQGHLIVAGRAAYNSQTGYDYLTVKYNLSGDLLWQARYNGPANGTDGARAVGVDGNGNVYVAGQSGGSGGDEYATLRYGADGTERWVSRFTGPTTGPCLVTGLAVAADNTVAVTGSAWGASGTLDFTTLKYAAALPDPPAAPSQLTASATGSAILLHWADNSADESGFIVERKTGVDPFAAVANVSAGTTSYPDPAVTAGTRYTYRVRATGPGGASAPSNEVTFTAPGGLTGKLVVNPRSLNFGKVPVGAEKLKKLRIKNTGKGVLSGRVDLSATAFSLVSGGGEFSLARGKSVTVTLRFAPSAVGALSGSLSIQSDDPAHPGQAVPLAGAGK